MDVARLRDVNGCRRVLFLSAKQMSTRLVGVPILDRPMVRGAAGHAYNVRDDELVRRVLGLAARGQKNGAKRLIDKLGAEVRAVCRNA